jgi:hypothetical protein
VKTSESVVLKTMELADRSLGNRFGKDSSSRMKSQESKAGGSSDFYVIYNVGTQFASIAPANPPQVREMRFAVKYTYSFAP